MKKALNVGAIISFLILGYVALALAFELVPQITDLPIPTNTTAIVETTLTISKWIIPVGAVIGIILSAIIYFRGKVK